MNRRDDDEFTGGIANLTQRCGLFSFHRYGNSKLALSRACKTASHEVLHMYGIRHCVYRHCLMNGCGHLLEDFAAPHHLCPVDLEKLNIILGTNINLLQRYKALLKFCEGRNGFNEHIIWLRRVITIIEIENCSSTSSSSSSISSLSSNKKKRKRSINYTPVNDDDDIGSLDEDVHEASATKKHYSFNYSIYPLEVPLSERLKTTGTTIKTTRNKQGKREK